MTEEDALSETHLTVEQVARNRRTRLLAFLAVRFGDIAAAEDALSEAFASALATWPRTGCPQNPEAWLLTAARRKRIDQIRRVRETTSSDGLEQLTGVTGQAESDLPDRRMALLFACTHPAIDAAVRAPLMLQVILGLEAAQIASAFLVSPAAMAQRLVRAKAKIRDAGIPFRIPDRDELPDRLESVLDAVYAAFAEGWVDAAGADPARRELAGEAIYLGRMLTELLPDEPEALGLLALMLYTEARRAARRSFAGRYVPLLCQNTELWDWQMIENAERALRRASRAGRIGRFQLEAAIQSAHIESTCTGVARWSEILSLYDALVQLTASPVASLNRAVVLAETEGVDAAIGVLDAISVDRRLESYQPYWAARAHLLARTGQHAAARRAYQIAMGLESDPAVRDYLSECAANLSA